MSQIEKMFGQLHLTNMATTVKVQDAKTRLSEILVQVEAGEEFIISRGNTPIARLVAIEKAAPRKMGILPGGPIPDSFFEPLPEEELRHWQ